MSLSAHLTSGTAEHGRLAFHPDCPRCRAERLAGSLGADALVSRRMQAALAAGVLAFSAAAPSALAQGGEVDQEQEGTVEPGGDAPGLGPDFDPGGDDTLDVDTAPVQSDPGAGGQEDDGLGAPVDTEPTTDPEVPRVLEQPEDTPEPPSAVPEPAPSPAPPPQTPIPPGPAAPVPPPAVEVEPPAPVPESPKTSTKHRPSKPAAKRPHTPKRATQANPAPVSAAPTPAAPAPAPVAQSAPETAVPASQPTEPPASPVTGDSYTVRPGDSLWSIARCILGPQASAGQIAREVNRLWQLNEGRIRTGNPSLIHIGAVLRLR